MEESTSNDAESADPVKPHETEEKKPKARRIRSRKPGNSNSNNNNTTKQTTPVSTHRGMATGIEEHVFITGPNMGKQWMITREKIIAWATATYGNSVKKSLMTSKVTVVDTDPPSTYTKAEYEALNVMETQTWLMELKAYQAAKSKLKLELGKFYAVLYSHCDPAIQNKLQSMDKFDDIDSSGNSIGLLQLIDNVCSSTDGTQYKYLHRL